ncbi:MAG: hypothetical protein J1F67_09155 [Muribaculaceae bacterium]|nr:hypothetical protein [Muribaculaceae bacterium]
MLKINDDFYKFIEQNKDKDPNNLRLSLKPQSYTFDLNLAITQIECRKKVSLKLKNFISSHLFIFPDTISAEQSSHQAVAYYHSNKIKENETVCDMTAGLGIDSMSCAKKGGIVTALELDPLKAEALNYNSKVLGLKAFQVINTDSIEYLRHTNLHYNVIFADPSRRGECNKRLYNLRDCSPNIIENQDILLKHCDKLLIKASPLLDISQTIKDFPYIVSISAIGVKGECKELLIELKSSGKFKNNNIKIEAVNLDNDGEIISFFTDELNIEKNSRVIDFATEQDLLSGAFLLEPSAMVMKLSPWETICTRFEAKKIGKSSHLFVTQSQPSEFPGRVTKIMRIIRKQDRKSLIGLPATVVSRNHPLKAEEIRRVYKLKEGTDNFIYATKLGDKPVILESISC